MIEANDPYTRVKDEWSQLNDRLFRLNNLLSGKQPENISDYQWGLLWVQMRTMETYLMILHLRLKDFEND